MGNQFVDTFLKQSFSQNLNWQTRTNQENSNKKTYFEMSRKLIGQEYLFTAPSIDHTLKQELQVYLFRNRNPHYFVTVYDMSVVQDKKQDSASIFTDCMLINRTKNPPIKIIYQKTLYRLSDIGQISFHQMIYILGVVLMGLNTLWLNFGKTYYMDEDFIAFNREGKCKIWVNQHFQRNFPNIQAQLNIETLIDQLMQCLQCRTTGQIPDSYLRQRNSSTFEKFSQALLFIAKTKKKFNISLDCIKRLKKDEFFHNECRKDVPLFQDLPIEKSGRYPKNQKLQNAKLSLKTVKNRQSRFKSGQKTQFNSLPLQKKNPHQHQLLTKLKSQKQQTTEAPTSEVNFEQRNKNQLNYSQFGRKHYQSRFYTPKKIISVNYELTVHKQYQTDKREGKRLLFN